MLARESLLPKPEKDAREAMALVGTLLRAVLAEPFLPLRKLPPMEIVRTHLHAEMAMETAEQFRVIFIDASGYLLAEEIISRGTLDETMMPPREIVQRALQLGASSLILAHNHPSGSCEPSEADVRLTRELARTCGGLKISVLDHIIVARPGCFSMCEHGYLST